MANAFASQDWADELLARLRRDSLVRSDAATWAHGPVLLVVDPGEDVPEALGLRLDLHLGEVRELKVVEPTAELAARTPFGIAGSLARWKALVGGELEVVDAILEAKVRARGDLLAIARHGSLFDRVMQHAGSLETVWQDEAGAESEHPAGAARS